jgi:hypothetical protein
MRCRSAPRPSALSGLLPVSRSIIFCLYGIENGFVTLRSLSALRRNLGKATTTLALGAGSICHLCTQSEPSIFIDDIFEHRVLLLASRRLPSHRSRPHGLR